jgi:stearoyl-CoA desaturase (delta-9 desaturase)
MISIFGMTGPDHWLAGLAFFIFDLHFSLTVWSLYVHRYQAHRIVDVGRPLEHFFRLWLWLHADHGWGKRWLASHRKHHAMSDTAQDPNSPHFYTLKQLLTYWPLSPGNANYISPEDVEKYGKNIQDKTDWLELNLYKKYPRLGLCIVCISFILLFGLPGIIYAFIARYWMSVTIVIVGNWAQHKFGYAVAGTKDHSRQFLPIGFLWGGEELHAGHHSNPSSANFAVNWWELDCGYLWIKLFSFLGLVRIKGSR